mmetsp:Transcript_4504/g.13537  ORF Transcript_4504/g.13537 Transcript_4504/m.13537 type:complete len:82 (+) Transcript_4504:2593-2838(+)
MDKANGHQIQESDLTAGEAVKGSTMDQKQGSLPWKNETIGDPVNSGEGKPCLRQSMTQGKRNMKENETGTGGVQENMILII